MSYVTHDELQDLLATFGAGLLARAVEDARTQVLPGTVTDLDGSTARVLIDGNATEIDVANAGTAVIGGRVQVLFFPPHGAVVLGPGASSSGGGGESLWEVVDIDQLQPITPHQNFYVTMLDFAEISSDIDPDPVSGYGEIVLRTWQPTKNYHTSFQLFSDDGYEYALMSAQDDLLVVTFDGDFDGSVGRDFNIAGKNDVNLAAGHPTSTGGDSILFLESFYDIKLRPDRTYIENGGAITFDGRIDFQDSHGGSLRATVGKTTDETPWGNPGLYATTSAVASDGGWIDLFIDSDEAGVTVGADDNVDAYVEIYTRSGSNAPSWVEVSQPDLYGGVQAREGGDVELYLINNAGIGTGTFLVSGTAVRLLMQAETGQTDPMVSLTDESANTFLEIGPTGEFGGVTPAASDVLTWDGTKVVWA